MESWDRRSSPVQELKIDFNGVIAAGSSSREYFSITVSFLSSVGAFSFAKQSW